MVALIWYCLVILSLFGLFQLLFSDRIFNSVESKFYLVQWVPVFGLFYSFYLRWKYGYFKGFFYLPDLHCHYNFYIFKDKCGNEILDPFSNKSKGVINGRTF